MRKSTSIQLILATALAGGAVYYLFATKRGIQLRKRLVKEAAATLDGLLETLENQLTAAEARAREEMEEVREKVSNI